MDWGKIIGAVLPIAGKTLSGGSKGMEKSRENQNSENVTRDRTALTAIGQNEQAIEDRRKIELLQRELDSKTRDSGYKQALHAQYLQNWTPASRT